MKAVIIAGGLGTRLRPLTLEMPKALIPVQGISLTEHVINKLKEADVDEVYLSVGHMHEKIQEYFKNGSKFGVKINYIVETEPLGTGGWMHLVNKNDFKEDFFVINGDNLFDLDLNEFMNFHKEKEAVVSIGLHPVEDVTPYGVMNMDGEKILQFVEKPKQEEAPSNLINSGYYLFSPKTFEFVPEQKRFMFETDFFPKIAKAGKLFGFKSDAKWFDTGTFERWDRVIKEWKK